MRSNPVAEVFFVMMGQKIYTLTMSFLEDSLSGSIFSEVVWNYKLDYFHDRIYFPNIGCHGNKKDNFPVMIVTVATRKKTILQKLESDRFKPPLQKVG